MNISIETLSKEELETMASVINRGIGSYLMHNCDGDCANCRDRNVCQTLELFAARLDEMSR